MQDCQLAPTPMIEIRLKKALNSYTCKPQALKDYQTLLGRIIYLMIKTHPNLAHFVSRLAEFSSNPTDKH